MSLSRKLGRKLGISFLFVMASSVSVTMQAQSLSLEHGVLPPTNHPYFPTGVFYSSPIRDNSTAAWYAGALTELSEVSLLDLGSDKTIQVYRLLWLPSLHRPISVRVTINGDGSGSVVTRSTDKHASLIVAKTAKDKPANASGKLVVDVTGKVAEAEVQQVLKQLQSLEYWSMKTEDDTSSYVDEQGRHFPVLGADGARWLLEGVKKGEYHVVDRRMPEYPGSRIAPTQDYARLCRYLLRLGKVDVVDVKEKDVY
jgi:hypothetical protein